MQLRDPKMIKPSRKKEANKDYASATAIHHTAIEDMSLMANDSDDNLSSEISTDVDHTQDDFKSYLKALRAVLPPRHKFVVREIDSFKYHNGERLKCGKVLVGRQREDGAGVWAFLKGETGERVICRDEQDDFFILPTELDSAVEFEPVFQLLVDSFDHTRLQPATRRRVWIGRVSLMVRLVLRDVKLYSPTVQVTHNRLKKDAFIATIRYNLARAFEEQVATPEPDVEPHEQSNVDNTGGSNADSTEAESRDSNEIANSQTYRRIPITQTSTQQKPQDPQASLFEAFGPHRAPSDSDEGHGSSSDRIRTRKRQRTMTHNKRLQEQSRSQEEDGSIGSTRTAQVPSTTQEETSILAINQGSQDQYLSQNQQRTLKGFAERKVKEAREKEKEIATRQAAGLQSRIEQLQNLVKTQGNRLEDHSIAIQKLEEQLAASETSADNNARKAQQLAVRKVRFSLWNSSTNTYSRRRIRRLRKVILNCGMNSSLFRH
jgi:hypothetical protein